MGKWLLRWLGILDLIEGLRRDLEAHARAIVELQRYQRQLEDRLGLRRLTVGDAQGRAHGLLLDGHQMKELRRESRARAQSQKG